jgi:hypothetical protein
MRKLHIRIWRTWVGPRGHKTQTGPIAFFRPRHHRCCTEYREYYDGPPLTNQTKGRHVVRQWFTECSPKDFMPPGV